MTLQFKDDKPNRPYGDGSFSGQVKAGRGCEKGRRVVLYSWKFYDGGTKVRRGADRTNDRGKYEIKSRVGAVPRHFRLKANAKRITKSNGDKVVCKARRSNRLGFG